MSNQVGPNTALERPTSVVGEENNFAVDLTGVLDDGELITGTPTVVEDTTTDLTISNEAFNTAAKIIKGKTVAIGKAVQFQVTGQLVANEPYRINITAVTDATPAQTKKVFVWLNVADD